jgi:hypothetical protein
LDTIFHRRYGAPKAAAFSLCHSKHEKKPAPFPKAPDGYGCEPASSCFYPPGLSRAIRVLSTFNAGTNLACTAWFRTELKPEARSSASQQSVAKFVLATCSPGIALAFVRAPLGASHAPCGNSLFCFGSAALRVTVSREILFANCREKISPDPP